MSERDVQPIKLDLYAKPGQSNWDVKMHAHISATPLAPTRAGRRLLLRWLCLRHGYRACIFDSNNHVCFYPELGVVFNRIKKSGNTTVAAFLNDLSSGGGADSNLAFKSSLLTPRNVPCKILLDIDSFFSVAVVRNPFSRTLSTFRHKVEPGVEGIYSRVGGHGVMGRDGFKMYLNFLRRGKITSNRHFWRQVDLLYKPPAEFSFIAKLEWLAEDMATALKELDLDPSYAARLSAPHPVEKKMAKITNSATKLFEYYDDEAVEMVIDLYKKDFEAFSYKECLEVF